MKLSAVIPSTILAISLTGCGEKPEPIALVVTMNTASGVAKVVAQAKGGIICEKGLHNIPRVGTIDITNENKLVQVGKNFEQVDSWNISVDKKYTTAVTSQGTTELRVINIEGNGTKPLYNEHQLAKTIAENCPR